MNIKIALGCISVSAALAFWACADGEVITADASEEVALQQVLHNRVTVEEAIASCNGNEACVAEMTDAPAADAPDSPKDEGTPDNSDNGSSLPDTNPGADNDPVVTPSSPSVTPVTPVTPGTSSASTPSTPTSSASTPKSSASTTTSSASQGGGQSSASVPTGSEIKVNFTDTTPYTFEQNKAYVLESCTSIKNLKCDAGGGGCVLVVNGEDKWTSYSWMNNGGQYQSAGNVCESATTISVKNCNIQCVNGY